MSEHDTQTKGFAFDPEKYTGHTEGPWSPEWIRHAFRFADKQSIESVEGLGGSDDHWIPDHRNTADMDILTDAPQILTYAAKVKAERDELQARVERLERVLQHIMESAHVWSPEGIHIEARQALTKTDGVE